MIPRTTRGRKDIALPDIEEAFLFYQCLCEARNYPDVPASLDEVMPGTRASLQVAAELMAQRRTLEPRPIRSRTVKVSQPTLRERLDTRKAG